MKKSSVYILCQALLLLLSTGAFCQDSYLFEHYTNENGLPANGIKGIELDKKTGFLWVGTQAGLVRFDGKHFTSFNSVKNTTDSRITFIAQNREGTIYCEDDNFSVYRIVNNRSEFVFADTILVDPFFIRGGNSSLTYTKIAERLRHHPRNSFLPDWMLFDDRDSGSFAFLYQWHFCHYNAKKDTLVYFGDRLFPQMLKLDGTVFLIDEHLGIWKYNDSLLQLLPVPVKDMPAWNGNERPRFLWKPGMKEPLLIYKRDLWKLQYSADTIHLQPFCQECCPKDAFIINAQIWEEQKIIFLASEINGLYVIRQPYMHTIRTDTLVEAGRAEYAQAEITPGMVTTGYGLSFSVQGKLIYKKNAIEFHPWDIYKDRSGGHWFHNVDTIMHLYKDGHCSRMIFERPINKIVFVETQNHLYGITDRAIIDIANDQYKIVYRLPYSSKEFKNSLDPDYAIEWSPGVIAIATEKPVLFDTEKGIMLDTIHIPGLSTKVRSLFKYNNYLLIGTYGQGFYMYKNGVVKKMPLDKNSYLSYAHCFMPDDKGYCWISTNHGLFKASLSALVKAYENGLNEIYYQYFGKYDGIFNTEFNGGCQPCALKMSNGLYSFPSMNGVVVFDPLLQHAPPPSGQIFIDEVWVDSSLYQANDPYLSALPYQSRNLRFKIALSQFSKAENIYFSYKLEPYNSEWETQDIVQNNTILFGGLKPGNYTLHLRVRNGFEPDQFSTTQITFSIAKPWYQTWIFYLFCLLGFIAMTWGLVKWRTARISKRKEELQQQVAMQTQNIEKQSKQLEDQLHQLQTQQVKLEEDNKIKTRLIGIISHDMISPLKFMSHMSNKLKTAFSSSDSNYHTASFIANIAQELELLSVNMLNWIKFHHGSVKMRAENFNLRELVAESVEIASTLAKEKGITFYNGIPEHTEIFQYRQAIGVIVYNLAMNAMKYTLAGEIRVICQRTGNSLSISVIDTGIGMPPELIKKLNSPEPFVAGYSLSETSKYQFGYVIIKDLLRLVHGSMIVQSKANEGTQATIHLAVENSGNGTRLS